MATKDAVIGLSTVFDRGKTTIPSIVRKKLKAKDGDQLIWLENTVSEDIIVRANIAIQESKGRFA